MAEGRAERRLITAVFIDIVGSTELTVSLGPERLKRALDRCFAEVSEAVRAEGGTVEKYIGDAIFAIFGAPTSHDDDPRRALRAAQQCLVRAAQPAEGKPAFSVRVGIETGEALVDLAAASTDRQRMAVGACVNVASRLQALAEPGTALVGPVCREAVGDAASLEALGDLDLKGLGRTAAWRLVAAATSSHRPHLAFIGRTAELEVLDLAYRRAAGGRSVLAVVSGPPGQGKTRLVEELVSRVGDGATLLVAHCRPGGEFGPLAPLRELLRATTAAEVRGRVGAVISDAAESERVSDALAHSAGLATSEALRVIPNADRQDEITNAWRRYLAALARERPLVVWIDDLHWADPQLVSLIDRLTQSGTAPLLVAVTARPEFAQQAGLRPTGHRFFIDLEPLGDVDAHALAALAGSIDDPISPRAEGNPLFIIELARARAVRDGALPLTLRGAIGARLDDLEDADRALLQAASVVGESFTWKDVATVAGGASDAIHRSLDRLVDLQYLRSMPDGDYRFHHGLVREVAYAQLPIAERLHLHARYAREGLSAEQVERRAHHLWEAIGGPDAEWVWEDADERTALRQEARETLLATAREHGQLYLLAAAIERGERALALADGPLDRARAHEAMGEAYGLAVSGDAALTHLRAAIDGYREAGATPPATIHAAISDVMWRPGGTQKLPDATEVERLLAEGLELARSQGDALSEARILAAIAMRALDPETKARRFAEAVALVDRAEDQRPFVEIFIMYSNSESAAGRVENARAILERAAALGGERNELYHLAIVTMAFALGDLATMDSAAARHAQLVTPAGPHQRMHPVRGRGLAALSRGDWKGARDAAIEVARTMEEHPETSFCIVSGFALTQGAAAAALQGSAEEARELLAKATRISQQPNVGAAFLALALGPLGRRGDVLKLDDTVPASAGWAHWIPIALAQLGEFDRAERRLPALSERAAVGDRFAGALVEALRQEIAASRGGPRPTHGALRSLGYLGFSELVAYRPKMD